MADSTADDASQEQNLQLRTALNDAYGFIEGQKSVQSFAAVTFEELADQQINTLVGPDTESRPNAYNRISKISTAVQQAVAKIKALPDNAFVTADPSTDVNTPQ